MTTPTFAQIQKAYDRDRQKIKDLHTQIAELATPITEQIAKLGAFQKAREDFLLQGNDMEAFEFMTALFINGREDKVEVKKAESNLNVDQKKLEEWLLKMLAKVGNSIATDSGTVYKTRKESVKVADFDAYVEAELVKPLTTSLLDAWRSFTSGERSMEELESFIREHLNIAAIDKSASKTFVLEQMGDKQKDDSRPNPAPPGIEYNAFATVGVRKPTTK